MSKIVVTIGDSAHGTSTITSGMDVTPSFQESVNKASPKTNEAVQNNKKSRSLAIASMVASRSFSYATSNVGKWTGSQRTQQSVNNTMELAQIGAMAFVSPAMAIATVGMNLATTAFDTAWEQKWDKLKSEQMLARAGYSSSGEIVGRRH